MLDERLPKKILCGELQVGKRSHGGQKKRYKDTIKASLKDFNIPTESWEQIAQDRTKWRGLIKRGASRPRWLSWMRRPTGDQEVAGSTPAEVGNILSWRLIMKYFLRSFSPFC